MYERLLNMWINYKITIENLVVARDVRHWIDEVQYETIINTPRKVE